MDQELTNMKMDKKELKESNMGMAAPTTAGSSPKGPQYPWGLEVRLEDSALKKMKVKLSDFKIGEVVELYAQCKVTRISQSEREGEDNPNRSLELQITDMSLGAADEEEEKGEGGLDWDEDEQSADKKLKKKGY